MKIDTDILNSLQLEFMIFANKGDAFRIPIIAVRVPAVLDNIIERKYVSDADLRFLNAVGKHYGRSIISRSLYSRNRSRKVTEATVGKSAILVAKRLLQSVRNRAWGTKFGIGSRETIATYIAKAKYIKDAAIVSEKVCFKQITSQSKAVTDAMAKYSASWDEQWKVMNRITTLSGGPFAEGMPIMKSFLTAADKSKIATLSVRAKMLTNIVETRALKVDMAIQSLKALTKQRGLLITTISQASAAASEGLVILKELARARKWLAAVSQALPTFTGIAAGGYSMLHITDLISKSLTDVENVTKLLDSPEVVKIEDLVLMIYDLSDFSTLTPNDLGAAFLKFFDVSTTDGVYANVMDEYSKWLSTVNNASNYIQNWVLSGEDADEDGDMYISTRTSDADL